MRNVSIAHDKNHICNFCCLAKYLDIKKLIPTILTVLIGIRIAATTGVSIPCTAKYNPMRLYITEKVKASNKVVLPCRTYFMRAGKFFKPFASRITSQGGRK